MPRDHRSALVSGAPNALTLSRFVLAAMWILLANSAPDNRAAFAAIAIVAAATDFIDGRMARRLGVARESGGWLDSVADVTFVLAALGCYATAHELPWAIPVLIAISFGQYALDSLWLHRAGAPVRSRLGHWGGIINYALVIAMALGEPGSFERSLIGRVVPIIELFYIAAVIERALAYRRV
ncbi:MAG TPA: CDP-alcohol phosphatidyltransferase family protein [Candidatus Binataceae bacterium]|nr:CDP-alcohol phosphatidyltransferase family protein [Candidatus Binataceae bacterium]